LGNGVVECCFAHLKPSGSLSNGEPLANDRACPGKFFSIDNGLAAALSPAHGGGGQASARALLNQVTFKLTECAE